MVVEEVPGGGRRPGRSAYCPRRAFRSPDRQGKRLRDNMNNVTITGRILSLKSRESIRPGKKMLFSGIWATRPEGGVHRLGGFKLVWERS